jgi:hypothetical protein
MMTLRSHRKLVIEPGMGQDRVLFFSDSLGAILIFSLRSVAELWLLAPSEGRGCSADPKSR